jgi:hypothetical protein
MNGDTVLASQVAPLPNAESKRCEPQWHEMRKMLQASSCCRRNYVAEMELLLRTIVREKIAMQRTSRSEAY